jgi:hypothetical protein
MKREDLPIRYEIANIALEQGKDDVFWVRYVGDVPEQGGIQFGAGSIGFTDLNDAIKFVKSTIKKNLGTYKELIKQKEGWSEKK